MLANLPAGKAANMVVGVFRTSRPVTATGFHNRTQLLERVDEAIDQLIEGAPKWLALIGPRRVGKTSLLLEAARRHAANPQLAFLVLDLQEQAPLSNELWRWFATQTVEALLGAETSSDLTVLLRRPHDFRRALQSSSSFMRLSPTTRDFLNELPDAAADDAFVRACLGLPERMATELDRFLVVALDEFQEIDQLAKKRGAMEPFQVLRSVWQRQERVGYFISGSARTMLTELVTSKRSPFFLHFEILEVGPFSRADAETLLVNGGISDPMAQTIIKILGGHPFYLQLMGEELIRQDEPHDDSTLKDTLQSVLFSRTGRLSMYFAREYDRLVGRSAYLAAVLEALSDGPMRATDIATRIHAPRGDTRRYLERLGDAVEKQADGLYTLVDSVFGAWIRWRQPGGSVVPMTLVGNDAERAVAHHLAESGFDLVYQSRASRGAFDLLATRGPHQLGVQVKKSKLPLRFKKTAWRRMEADAQQLGWRWVIAVVDPADKVHILDPQDATVGREIRLSQDAGIENVVAWIEGRPPT